MLSVSAGAVILICLLMSGLIICTTICIFIKRKCEMSI